MSYPELLATLNAMGVTGLLAFAVYSAVRGEWVPGYLYRQQVAYLDALVKDHAALRAEFDDYRRAHP